MDQRDQSMAYTSGGGAGGNGGGGGKFKNTITSLRGLLSDRSPNGEPNRRQQPYATTTTSARGLFSSPQTSASTNQMPGGWIGTVVSRTLNSPGNNEPGKVVTRRRSFGRKGRGSRPGLRSALDVFNDDGGSIQGDSRISHGQSGTGATLGDTVGDGLLVRLPNDEDEQPSSQQRSSGGGSSANVFREPDEDVNYASQGPVDWDEDDFDVDGDFSDEDKEREELDEVVDKVFFQSGTTSSPVPPSSQPQLQTAGPLPLLVFCPCNLTLLDFTPLSSRSASKARKSPRGMQRKTSRSSFKSDPGTSETGLHRRISRKSLREKGGGGTGEGTNDAEVVGEIGRKRFDKVVDRILVRMEAYMAGGGYVAVIFSQPSSSFPTQLLISTYLRLPRPVRKNLRRLYIVHPSFWVRMAVKIFLNGIVSGKVGKRGKVKCVGSISELAREGVEVWQIDIPPAVYSHNLTVEPTITIPESLSTTSNQVFGVALGRLMGQSGESGLPSLVKDCIEVFRENGGEGLGCEGVFRKNSSASVLKMVTEAYDRGHPVSLSSFTDAPHLAAGLLKRFLRSLPEPLFPITTYSQIQSCPIPKSDASSPTSAADAEVNSSVVHYLTNRLLPSLEPQANVVLLSHVLRLLHDISMRRAENLMDSHNLSVCITPVLVRSDDVQADIAISHVPGGVGMNGTPLQHVSLPPGAESRGGGERVSREKTTLGALIRFMIDRYHEIFDDLDTVPSAPIVRPPLFDLDSSPERPDPPSDEDEDGSNVLIMSEPGPTPSPLASPMSTSSKPPTTRFNSIRRPRALSQSKSVLSVASQAGSSIYGQSPRMFNFGKGKGAGTIVGTTRGAGSGVEASGVSVMGLFAKEPKEAGQEEDG